jgi:predicted phosphodiesterase
MSPLRVPRTLVLSDLHLGRPNGAGRADAFEALLADFDRVIVNGDVAELHHPEFAADAEIELARLRDICFSRGIKLDLVAGNHDPFVSDVRSVTLAEGAIYVTHGDALHPAVAPWSPCAAIMREAYAAALGATPSGTPEDAARFAAAREASLAEWRAMGDGAHVSTIGGMARHPLLAMSVVAYWSRYPQMVSSWVGRFAPQAGTVIVGHSHRGFVRMVDGRQIVNTGAYSFPGRPTGVVVEGTTVRVHRLAKRGHLFALAQDAVAAWPINFHARGLEQLPERPEPGQASAASTPAMNRAASPSASPSIDGR